LRALGSATVERMIVGSLRWFSVSDRELAVEIVESAPIATDSRIAAEVASVLTDDRVLSWELLTSDQQERFLDKLADTPDISEYGIEHLLSRQIAIEPSSVARLLMRRVDHQDRQEGVSDQRFVPIPHPPVAELSFRGSEHFPAILAELIDWLANGDVWRRSLYGDQLFELIVGPFDAEVLSVVSALIASRDESQIGLAVRLLSKAGHGFLRSNVQFVADTLAIIDGYPDEWVQRVRAGLRGTAVYGMRSRTVGEDDPAEVALRDDALEIARSFPEGSAAHSLYTEVSIAAARRLAEERDDDRRLADPRRW
jgi:hypothetical protein